MACDPDPIISFSSACVYGIWVEKEPLSNLIMRTAMHDRSPLSRRKRRKKARRKRRAKNRAVEMSEMLMFLS